jgi:putative ABC transport system permease protein
LQDYKLAFRMLMKFPGLTIAGGLALALAIGIGAGWYDFTRDFLRPPIPLPDGDRIVEIEMRNAQAGGDERRVLHDLMIWQRDVRSLEELGAYRTVERNLVLGDAPAESVTLAETSAAAFRIARVPPVLGRPLLDADEQPGAAPVVVLGYSVWQRLFAGRTDVIGRTIRLGGTMTTVVGVMPESFAFPINHRLWIPLQLRPSGYAALEGPAVRVYGRIAPGATQAQANAELATLAERAGAASPETHEHLRPRVLAYGGESPGDRSLLERVVRHLPILFVLIVACANVGTLIYARTATREAEIATRYALGASRTRIVAQLFVEALVLAAMAAIVGLTGAHWALKWGVTAYYGGMTEALPFWLDPGLKFTTVIFAAALTLASAAILGVLPALKVTGAHAQTQLRNLGTGGSTLRFGPFWTTAMIAQVALTVILLPPAMGISEEAVRDRIIRQRFPAEQYLTVRVDLDAVATTGESTAASDARLVQIYQELERRIREQANVVDVTFGDRLPGMEPDVGRGEVEVSTTSELVEIPDLWMAAVGPRYFESFDIPLVAGRDFHDGDRTGDTRTAIVNEAFARRYLEGASPVGGRVRFASSGSAKPEPWFEIVGMVRDIGMTPTDLGEAPYLFTAATPTSANPLVLGVRVSGDPAALAPRLRAIAAGLDVGLRLEEVRPLDESVWRVDIPMVVGASAIVGIVSLGLFMSASGIFSLMSVSIARRTREIGLRTALGASRLRLLGDVFRRALVLVGSGIAAGNLVLIFFVWLSDEADLADIGRALLVTSSVMLAVGLLACLEPARRALRIHPSDALKEA